MPARVTVAHVPGEHGFLLPGRAGDRAGPGIVLTCLRIGIRLRQLTSDQRAMEEKLQAARSSNRFLDKRIGGLEAQLLDAGISGKT
jgi:hypothetical protein